MRVTARRAVKAWFGFSVRAASTASLARMPATVVTVVHLAWAWRSTSSPTNRPATGRVDKVTAPITSKFSRDRMDDRVVFLSLVVIQEAGNPMRRPAQPPEVNLNERRLTGSFPIRRRVAVRTNRRRAKPILKASR